MDQELNEKLEIKSFAEKKKILLKANVGVDEHIAKATSWGQSEIEARAKFLSSVSFNDIWKL